MKLRVTNIKRRFYQKIMRYALLKCVRRFQTWFAFSYEQYNRSQVSYWCQNIYGPFSTIFKAIPSYSSLEFLPCGLGQVRITPLIYRTNRLFMYTKNNIFTLLLNLQLCRSNESLKIIKTHLLSTRVLTCQNVMIKIKV